MVLLDDTSSKLEYVDSPWSSVELFYVFKRHRISADGDKLSLITLNVSLFMYNTRSFWYVQYRAPR